MGLLQNTFLLEIKAKLYNINDCQNPKICFILIATA